MLLLSKHSASQLKSANEVWKWTTWTLLQAIPSPTYFDDRGEDNSKLKFGLEWQVIPFSYSFNTNKYVSKLNFFYIIPAKRFSGSAELFFEPSYIPGGFKYSELKKFMYKAGARIVFPVSHKGEYFAFSFGAGYYSQKTVSGELVDGPTYEACAYTLFGMLGLKFNYNQKSSSRYNFGIYFKYF
ncbi:MAG: hypothetical protein L0Y79_07015 [Chlorobi bacterium]|nr:hypothetical protein [Chlorobiota bacterium]MCI0714792.1 hypothetical protein [Chlorobiota bacterium]